MADSRYIVSETRHGFREVWSVLDTQRQERTLDDKQPWHVVCTSKNRTDAYLVAHSLNLEWERSAAGIRARLGTEHAKSFGSLCVLPE